MGITSEKDGIFILIVCEASTLFNGFTFFRR